MCRVLFFHYVFISVLSFFSKKNTKRGCEGGAVGFAVEKIRCEGVRDPCVCVRVYICVFWSKILRVDVFFSCATLWRGKRY